MSEIGLLRIAHVVAGLALLLAIRLFGRPRPPPQGTRVEARGRDGERMEPTLGAQLEQQLAAGTGYGDEALVQSEMDLLDDAIGAVQPNSELGKRVSEDFDKIITLYIAARAGHTLRGPDNVVAAEKAGLTYGHMNVFHRLVQGHPEQGPVFSVANVKKPGSFEMAEIQSLETPAIAFFLTLPAPVAALDAWEMMQPAAERMAELLEGVVLDEQRNPLGRQRVQHLCEEMRAHERQSEVARAKPARW